MEQLMEDAQLSPRDRTRKLDPNHREKYLSDGDFKRLLSEWDEKPQWKRDAMKKALGKNLHNE